MDLNVAQETIAASDDNRKVVGVTGDRVDYGMLDTEGTFVKEGSLEDGESVVLAHARVFRPTGFSQINVWDGVDDDPDVTPEDSEKLLANAETRPKKTSLAHHSRDDESGELAGDDLERAGRDAGHPRLGDKAWSGLSADEKRQALSEAE